MVFFILIINYKKKSHKIREPGWGLIWRTDMKNVDIKIK